MGIIYLILQNMLIMEDIIFDLFTSQCQETITLYWIRFSYYHRGLCVTGTQMLLGYWYLARGGFTKVSRIGEKVSRGGERHMMWGRRGKWINKHAALDWMKGDAITMNTMLKIIVLTLRYRVWNLIVWIVSHI